MGSSPREREALTKSVREDLNVYKTNQIKSRNVLLVPRLGSRCTADTKDKRTRETTESAQSFSQDQHSATPQKRRPLRRSKIWIKIWIMYIKIAIDGQYWCLLVRWLTFLLKQQTGVIKCFHDNNSLSCYHDNDRADMFK